MEVQISGRANNSLPKTVRSDVLLTQTLRVRGVAAAEQHQHQPPGLVPVERILMTVGSVTVATGVHVIALP